MYYSRGCLVIIEISVDGATGAEVQGEAHTQGHVVAPIIPGILRLRDATNNEIAHIADHPFRVVLLELTVDAPHEMPMAGIDSPGRLGVQDSDQAQAAGRYNYDHAAEKSFYAPKTPKMPKKNGGAEA